MDTRQTKDELKAEIQQFSNESKLDKKYLKRKLIAWIVRTILTIILYIIFWKYEWVRWTLLLYIPLTIFNIVMIFGFNRLVDKKVKELNAKIDSVDES